MRPVAEARPTHRPEGCRASAFTDPSGMVRSKLRQAPAVLGAALLALIVAGPAPASAAASCTAALGGSCGPYADAADIPMSNGFDTYVADQDVGAISGTTVAVTATAPGSWSAVANAVSSGGAVQAFPDVQQLTNDWNASAGNWTGSSNTPLASLSALAVNYSESGPVDSGSAYEFAPDIWTSNYNADVMFWADTEGRCNTGSYGSTVLGTAVLDGQTWTVNRYGGAGAEIIFVLDSNPSVPDSCAHQTAGTIDVLAGLNWLVANGFMTGPVVLTQVNSGWEITAADSTTFVMNSYSITATPVGSSPSPTPTPSVTATSSPTPSVTPTPTATPSLVYACLENSSPYELFYVSVKVARTCPAGSTAVSWRGP